MFTGITEGTGVIVSAKLDQDKNTLEVEAGNFDIQDVVVGDSISVNGVCLTVVEMGSDKLKFDISPETLRIICPFNVDDLVNLEKSLKLADRLGGHLVSGHIDDVGEVVSIDVVNGNYEVEIAYSASIAKYISRKGSIAVNGVSLTVNDLTNSSFSVNLIPHTWNSTSLNKMQINTTVNLEIDLIARYIERIMSCNRD
ncbi:MAG: riboflavin synthase [Proteobacteria bacterium]|nr:riboflavin synthase [Pseudomonadota bacterium]